VNTGLLRPVFNRAFASLKPGHLDTDAGQMSDCSVRERFHSSVPLPAARRLYAMVLTEAVRALSEKLERDAADGLSTRVTAD